MQQKRPQRRKGWYCFVVEHLNWNQTGRDVVIIYRFSVSQDRIRRCDFISRFKMWVNFMKWVEIKHLSSHLELQAFLGTISPLWTTILVDICTTLPDMAGLCCKPMVHWHHPSKRRQIFYVDVPIVWLNLHVISYVQNSLFFLLLNSHSLSAVLSHETPSNHSPASAFSQRFPAIVCYCRNHQECPTFPNLFVFFCKFACL